MGILCKVKDVLKKNSPYDDLKGEWTMHSANGLVMCMGDW